MSRVVGGKSEKLSTLWITCGAVRCGVRLRVRAVHRDVKFLICCIVTLKDTRDTRVEQLYSRTFTSSQFSLFLRDDGSAKLMLCDSINHFLWMMLLSCWLLCGCRAQHNINWSKACSRSKRRSEGTNEQALLSFLPCHPVNFVSLDFLFSFSLFSLMLVQTQKSIELENKTLSYEVSPCNITGIISIKNLLFYFIVVVCARKRERGVWRGEFIAFAFLYIPVHECDTSHFSICWWCRCCFSRFAIQYRHCMLLGSIIRFNLHRTYRIQTLDADTLE